MCPNLTQTNRRFITHSCRKIKLKKIFCGEKKKKNLIEENFLWGKKKHLSLRILLLDILKYSHMRSGIKWGKK